MISFQPRPETLSKQRIASLRRMETINGFDQVSQLATRLGVVIEQGGPDGTVEDILEVLEGCGGRNVLHDK